MFEQQKDGSLTFFLKEGANVIVANKSISELLSELYQKCIKVLEMGLKLVMIRFSIIAPMTNTREQTKGLMMCLILNWNVFASCLMMWLINLLREV